MIDQHTLTPDLVTDDVEHIVDNALELLEEAQTIVGQKMHDFFFEPDGSVKVSEEEAFEWVADRTLDEYKVGYQAAELLNKYGHLMEPWLVNKIGAQVEEETMHYRMLYTILPEPLQKQVKYRMADFPSIVSKDVRWNSLVGKSNANDYMSALFEISLVFEGFACAAIQPVLLLPYKKITKAYDVIFRDEQSHHEIGLEFVRSICNTTELAEKVLAVAQDALERAKGCKHYTW